MVKSLSGYPIQSPYVSIANRQAELLIRIASGIWVHSGEPKQDLCARKKLKRFARPL
jgi:hypothetical protein